MKERQGARVQVRTRSEGNDASEVAPFLSMYLDGPRARLLLGFAAFSAWVNLLIGFEGFLRDTVVYGGGVVRDPLFVAALLLGGALLIAAALRQRPFLQLPEDGEMPRWRGAAVCGILGSLSGVAGVALSSSATTAGSVVMTLAVVPGMMAAVFIARYTLAWGVLIASFDLREMMVALCTALCLQWVPFIAVQFLGAVGKAVLAGGLPLLSLWGLRGFTSTPSESASSREGSSAGEAEGDSRWIVARMAAALFCFAFVVQFVWTCNVVMTSEPLDQGLFWLVYLCVFVACAVIMIAILCLMDRWRRLSYGTVLPCGLRLRCCGLGRAASGLQPPVLLLRGDLCRLCAHVGCDVVAGLESWCSCAMCRRAALSDLCSASSTWRCLAVSVRLSLCSSRRPLVIGSASLCRLLRYCAARRRLRVRLAGAHAAFALAAAFAALP